MDSDKQIVTGNREKKEIVLTGLGVSKGIAIGDAYPVKIEHPHAPQYEIEVTHIEEELRRFEGAAEKARANISDLKEKTKNLPEAAAEELNLLLDAHNAMLGESRLVKGIRNRIEIEHMNAEWAVEEEVQALAEQFEAMEDPYLAARIDDVRAVGNRLMGILLDLPYLSLRAVPEGGLVFAEEISPADTVLLDPRIFAGMATSHGGKAGHTAVMARSLGLPAVLGVSSLLDHIKQGDKAIIDGIEGKVILNPSPITLAEYQKQKILWQDDHRQLQEIADLPSETRDKSAITLRANLEMPRDLEIIQNVKAEGIGLFRTEFLFMNQSQLPTEDDQYKIYVDIMRQMSGHMVTFRTLDIGGDKLVKSLGHYMAECDNPALGLRAIRLSLKEPVLLKTQLRAMLRASAHGKMRILLPMVTTASEVREVRKIYEQCAEELRSEGLNLSDKIPELGVMIEIPAAALAADSLATVSDFFALGTNDLIQYTIAIDRGNDQVADLYDPLNPAVLRLIEFSIQAALRARIPISICGEMAADTRLTGLLLGLGIREMSVGPATLLSVKRRIREIDLVTANRHAQMVMDQYDSGRILTIVNDFNKE